MDFTCYRRTFSFLLLLSILAMISACSVTTSTRVKEYPVGKPFVFNNRIELTGSMSKDEKNRLLTDLENYWDDSAQARRLQRPGFFYMYRLQNPPVFDTANVTRSVNYMNAYLNAQGYYYATYKDSVRIDTVKDQLRTNLIMYIDAGKNISIDSVSFNLADSNLQRLTMEQKEHTLLVKGKPYSKDIINSELDRLVNFYRQNGYYFFTREDIYALVDSIDANLLTLTLDPFRQAQIIAEAARNRRIDPKWDITVMRKASADTNKLVQYYVGKTYFYPESKLAESPDSLIKRRDFRESTRRGIVMRYKQGKFHYRPLREHSYLRTGDLYNEANYFKTINTLGQLGAWQQVDGKAVPRGRDTLDLYYFLIPAVKQSYTLGLEASRNTADIGLGNLWGFTGNIEYTNRNVWKGAIQSLTTFRTGVELNILTSNQDPLVQTFLIGLGHTYSFPRLIQPFSRWRALNRLDNKRTLFSINGSYVDRREYYQLRSLVTNWGYEWKKGNNVWLYRPLNLEFYALDKLAKLDTLIKQNPFLKTSFNEGRIISQSVSLLRSVTSARNPRASHRIRLSLEEAGGLFGLIPGLQDNIYRYVKAEAEFTRMIKFRRTELAWHLFGGAGYSYGGDTATNQTMPFFKQFSAGGPYSMRAWGLRQLGLGSSTLAEQDTAKNSYRDRFGDMRLEANIEYRFPITTIAGAQVSSALFADIGNVWNVKRSDIDPMAAFSFSNLYRDLAVGVGTGIRMDFSYFLIRVDCGFKLKDPLRPTPGGWANSISWNEYRTNGLKVNNYAIQLGIGLPF
ncbi:translocation and assembly module lipoprotein TamL [Sediminibacterium soli]|uniref:translocation and assembly module lipoprotein TamL n=1 Tax=Sediminibacterium soli TaxID=2698829 RepID=UPI001379CD45|nr:BamA/TamA family outer membrane protein [Sediminibacterium soli]NCI46121.1 BamA/TamA family outer membrane protein [Sediminibacterium soli]